MSNSVSIQADRCLRISDVADRLGVSRATVYRLLPQIEHISFPGSNILVVTERALAEFMERHKRPVSARFQRRSNTHSET